jgi:hypothetical protein
MNSHHTATYDCIEECVKVLEINLLTTRCRTLIAVVVVLCFVSSLSNWLSSSIRGELVGVSVLTRTNVYPVGSRTHHELSCLVPSDALSPVHPLLLIVTPSCPSHHHLSQSPSSAVHQIEHHTRCLPQQSSRSKFNIPHRAPR